MAAFNLAPDPIQSTFFIPGGNTPGNGAQLFTYTAGSSSKTTVYKDSAGATPWTNPIVLDSGGNLPNGGVVWIPTGITIKVVWAPSNDTDPPSSPYRTIDNVTGINDTTQTPSEWVAGPTPTYISGTSFSLVGDQTATFTIGRRIKATVTAGTVYGRITNSVFTSLTTVTVQMDGSQALDSGMSAVNYALLSSLVLSVPNRYASTQSTNTYSATLGISRYVLGEEYRVNVTSSNTTSTPTINLDAVSTVPIVRPDASVIVPGELSGQHTLRYNGSQMVVLNPNGNSAIIPFDTGGSAVTAGSTTVFLRAANWTGVETSAATPVPFKGTARNLYANAQTNPGSTSAFTYTYTLRKNNADTALTCQTVSTFSGSKDITHFVQYAQGDTMDLSLVPTSTAASTQHWALVEYVRTP